MDRRDTSERAVELNERALKLNEREGKLNERERKLNEREGKLNEREGQPGGFGWPFAADALRASGFGGLFITAFIAPVAAAHRQAPGDGAGEDLKFQAVAEAVMKEQT